MNSGPQAPPLGCTALDWQGNSGTSDRLGLGAVDGDREWVPQLWESHIERMGGYWRYSEARDDKHDNRAQPSWNSEHRTYPPTSLSERCNNRAGVCVHSPPSDSSRAPPRGGGGGGAPGMCPKVPKPVKYNVPSYDPLIAISFVLLCLLTSFCYICKFVLSSAVRHHWRAARGPECSVECAWCRATIDKLLVA
jgi:hypothetical protein